MPKPQMLLLPQYTFVVLLFGLLFVPNSSRRYLALNMITLVCFQTLLILLFGGIAGFVPLILVQLLSLFASCNLPGAWKLLLPGNWGMAIRSTLATSDGYPLLWTIGIEVLLLLVLWAEGWRLVRWYSRKDGKI